MLPIRPRFLLKEASFPRKHPVTACSSQHRPGRRRFTAAAGWRYGSRSPGPGPLALGSPASGRLLLGRPSRGRPPQAACSAEADELAGGERLSASPAAKGGGWAADCIDAVAIGRSWRAMRETTFADSSGLPICVRFDMVKAAVYGSHRAACELAFISPVSFRETGVLNAAPKRNRCFERLDARRGALPFKTTCSFRRLRKTPAF